MVVLTEALEARRLLAAQPYHWPVGAETLVNSYTTYYQGAPAMAMDADGDFVVTWTSNYQDGSSSGVYAQRFNSAGLPQGGEFRVNTTTSDTQQNPSVAMDADGDFVVSWEGGYFGYSINAGVYAQRYNASGVPQGTEFRVDSSTTFDHVAPSVAMDAGGDFVIVWYRLNEQFTADDVYAQRYNAAGVKQGMEFRVNTTIGAQSEPSVAMDADGDFVVAWHGHQGPSPYDIYAQRFNALGARQGSEFRVNSYTTDYQRSPAVAVDADGDFVVAWYGAGPGDDYGIFARRYNPAGAAQGTDFRVNTFTMGTQRKPSAAMDAVGDFVVTWESGSIEAQRYSSAGAALGTEFRVNSNTVYGQLTPSAAMYPSGDFVVAWSGAGQGDVGGIFAQRYTTFGPASAAAVGNRVWNDSNANGIQDTGEAGIAGATVELSSVSGAGVGIVSTNAAGLYSIPVLAGTSAFLHFTNPQGLLTTHENRGTNDELDSDIDRVTGLTPIFPTGAAGTSNTSFDAGFCLPGSVGGVAFNDRSGDGIRNGGEELLPGFHVFLDLNGNGTAEPTEPNAPTDSTGSYQFGNLLGDTYRLGIIDQLLWVEPALSPFLVLPGPTTPINLALRTSAPDSTSTKQGPEFRVNTYTTNSQFISAVAMDTDGDFVVVWQSTGQDGSDGGIYAQRYNAAGVKQGTEFRVNTTTSGNQNHPAVAMNDAGDFVIAWSTVGSGFGIFAQRYNAAGVKQGSELRVSQFSVAAQYDPAIAMDADGDFVVAWTDSGQGYGDIQARRYNAAGVAQGDQFTVNSSATFDDISPSVAMDADGDFVVGWRNRIFGYYSDPGDQILARRYDAAGVPKGPELEVGGAAPANGDVGPSLAIDDDGDFVISWASYEGISAQRYSAAEAPQGTALLVSTSTTGIRPSAAMDAAGGFTIAWTGPGDGSIDGISAQRFNAAGLRQGSELRVNTYTPNQQRQPSIAMDADGDFVVAWQSYRQDNSNYGVYAQRYAVSQRPAITSSQFIWQTAPQRLEFTFDQDVSASLSTADLVLRNLTTATTIPSSSIVINWNAATRTATFRFPTLPNGGSLPDGRYRATLPAAGVTNAAGTSIAVDYALQFFSLAGDANHDGRVNVNDFTILAGNFGQSNRTFSQGDFNYDNIVNISDFTILASRFGTALAPPSVSNLFGGERIGGAGFGATDDSPLEQLA